MKIKLLVAASFFIPAMAMAEAPPLKAPPLKAPPPVVAKPAVEAPKGDYSSAGKPPNLRMTCGPKKDGECNSKPGIRGNTPAP